MRCLNLKCVKIKIQKIAVDYSTATILYIINEVFSITTITISFVYNSSLICVICFWAIYISALFASWRTIEKSLNCDMYFADPYCAWQKGTNENLNGLLREFYPKGRNLERVSPKTLEKNLALINARPKKVLGFKKPVDLFNFFLSKCCT